MLFGLPEIIEYEKTCKDPYVLAIIKKLWESKSNSAKLHEFNIKLQDENAHLKEEIETLKYLYEKAKNKIEVLEDYVRCR